MKGQRSGGLSIIPACAYDDIRMSGELRDILGLLGTYSDAQGYSYPARVTIAARLGIARETVSRRMRRLVELGYLEVTHQFRPDGGQRSNLYRVLRDIQLPAERWRVRPEPPPDDDEDDQYTDPTAPVTPASPPLVTKASPPLVTNSVTPPGHYSVTPLNDPIERSKRTTQENAAAAAVIDLPARARAREDGSGGGGMPSLSLEKIAEAARMAPSGHFAGIIDRHALNMPPADLIAEASKAAEWQADHPDKQPHMTLAFLDNWFLRARAAAEEDKHHAERSAASNGRGTGGRPRTAARAKGPDINDFGDVTDWLR